MLVAITNSPRDYAWGSTTAIADLLGRKASGRPEAELWLGAHPASPSRIIDPKLTGGAEDLASWIARDPQQTLGRFASGGRLPFLLKVLAAATSLSLQAHPTTQQAVDGFERENRRGVPLSAPERNYRDPFAKPEIIFSVSPSFDALCGFRSLDQVRDIVVALLEADARRADPQPQPLEDLLGLLDAPDAPRSAFRWLVERGPGVHTLVSLVTELASDVSGWSLEFATVTRLANEYPGDPGIVASLMLNRVRLETGQALSLPAGNIHAYLEGLGVELMAASDNVLRGGLTPKHIDVDELVSVLDFSTVSPPFLEPDSAAAGLEVFAQHEAGFVLLHVTGDASWPIDGPAIALCTRGEFSVGGGRLARGDSAFITPDEGVLDFRGNGELFLATTSRG